MPSPPTRAAASPAIIQQGRITEVDASRWLCRVRPAGESSDIQVTVPSLYSHPFSGEGIHYLPEVGAVCYICRSSDNPRMPFLLMAGAATVPKDFSEKGGIPGSMDMYRPYLAPGDIALLTRDGNGLTLRRGGVTELRGTALSKIMFDPTKNKILTFAENYLIQTFGGKLEWKSLRREKDANGELSCQLSLSAKEFATSKGHSVRLRMGRTEEAPVAIRPSDAADQEQIVEEDITLSLSGSGTKYSLKVPKVVSLNDSARVLDLRVFSDETKPETDLEESLSLGIDREGDVLLETDGAVKIDVRQWVELAVDGNTPQIKTDAAGVRKVLVTKGTQGNTEPVILGETFLGDLQASLLEISTALKALGIPTVATDEIIAKITTSLVSAAPYLAATLEAE